MIARRIFLVLLFIVSAFSSYESRGDIVAFSTLGTPDSFSSSSYIIGPFAPANANNVHGAAPFVSSASGNVSGIEVAVEIRANIIPDEMEFILWENSVSNTPGDMIWNSSFVPPSTRGIVDVFMGPNTTTLNAGDNYWLSARSLNANSTYLWAHNDQGFRGDYAADSNGGVDWEVFPSQTMPAFRISVVPEPSSLLIFSLVAILAISRRKTKLQSL
jgi:hypothetical protein